MIRMSSKLLILAVAAMAAGLVVGAAGCGGNGGDDAAAPAVEDAEAPAVREGKITDVYSGPLTDDTPEVVVTVRLDSGEDVSADASSWPAIDSGDRVEVEETDGWAGGWVVLRIIDD